MSHNTLAQSQDTEDSSFKNRSGISSEVQTLVADSGPYKKHHVVVNDWSQSSRGFHVDFASNEKVPLEQGKNKPKC